MKKHGLRLLLTLCLATAFAVALGAVPAATESPPWYEMETTGDAYEFPITPEKTPEEWGKLRSIKKMLKVCQVPEEILETMSTEGLIETCLAYPLMGNMMAYNSIYDGFLKHIETFNGLRELLSREDAGPLLAEKYQALSLDDVLKSDDYPTYRLRYFEYILAQPAVLNTLEPAQKEALLDRAVQLTDQKARRYAETFSISPSTLLAGRILMEDEGFAAEAEEREDIRLFLEKGTALTSEVLQCVREQAGHRRTPVGERRSYLN